MNADVTALDLTTLIVAIVGAITGIVALVLQVIFLRSSGPGLPNCGGRGYTAAGGAP